MTARIPPRYRIDRTGRLWQRVAAGDRTPKNGTRALGQVAQLATGTYPGTVLIVYTAGTAGAKRREVTAHLENIIDERLTPPGPPRVRPLRPIAGGADTAMVTGKLENIDGPLYELVLPNGARFYVVVCPTCGADLCKVSIGRLVVTPAGEAQAQVYHPLECTACGVPLLPVPSRLVTAARPPARPM